MVRGQNAERKQGENWRVSCRNLGVGEAMQFNVVENENPVKSEETKKRRKREVKSQQIAEFSSVFSPFTFFGVSFSGFDFCCDKDAPHSSAVSPRND